MCVLSCDPMMFFYIEGKSRWTGS